MKIEKKTEIVSPYEARMASQAEVTKKMEEISEKVNSAIARTLSEGRDTAHLIFRVKDASLVNLIAEEAIAKGWVVNCKQNPYRSGYQMSIDIKESHGGPRRSSNV